MNITITDFKTKNQLPITHAYIPFYGSRESCLAQLEKRYPWLDSIQAFYHPATSTLFIPAEYIGGENASH